ncbi:glycoside hydrolase family 78 protein [Arthrobacter sp. NtRootA1]|uniref:glycoside hydrolase family 78 protein n=1 Tax=Arthrobacter sp. NtRootA1 TaxID=2830983 RepID=UPI001CC7127F|nr:glycoside hydrolase family 78 protein [Arthrobacter sp. NtRootA1]BCW05802.1 alpha-L-rhamnosidase [Arthrobacter sp. NtRootA1]
MTSNVTEPPGTDRDEQGDGKIRRWHGTFVGPAKASDADDPAAYFRREFDLAERPIRATLRVTALGIVVPYVNGTRVGDEVLAPGWTSYRHRLAVSTYDVTSLVVPGANAFGAVVGEGWAVGPLTWDNLRHNYSDRPALFAQVELEYPDRTEVIATDGKFRVASGGVRANGIYAGETYDARMEPEGWTQAGFEDVEWAAIEPVDWPLSSLVAADFPPIRRIEELAPVELRVTDAGTTIVDFGQNISGWVRIKVSGEAGTVITLRHAEILTPSGELERETNRTAEATDRYTLSGEGEEVWEPQFTFHGFRYAEVEGWPGELEADALQAVVVHSDMPRTGWFETSDELVTKLHQNTVWSMRDNFVGVPTDCPQRDERMGWTGDLNAFSSTATYLYDVRGVLGSWLADLAVEQKATGDVPWTVPDVMTTPSAPTALWSDVAVSLPWELYQEYGDAEILRSSYESMTSLIRQIGSLLDEQGLWTAGFQFGDWLDPDAPAANAAGGKTDRYLVASAYLVKTTKEMTETAAVLGCRQDEAEFRALHERVLNAFRRAYVTPSGRVVNESATAYALVIMFGILDEDQKQVAGNRLAEIVKKAKYRISTGFAGTPLVTDALSSTGHLSAAYRLLLEKKCPSFLYPVTMGATTIWERWDAIRPDGTLNSTGMTSLNHYALGAVASWLHRVVGGLVRLSPGWKHIRVAPQPGGGLTWARTAHETTRGRAEVMWQVESDVVTVEAQIPAGSTATVILPLHPENAVEDVSSGNHKWQYQAAEPYGQRPSFTLDSPLMKVAEHPEVWDAVLRAITKHLPHFPVETTELDCRPESLNTILESMPGAPAGLRGDLQAALAG